VARGAHSLEYMTNVRALGYPHARTTSSTPYAGMQCATLCIIPGHSSPLVEAATSDVPTQPTMPLLDSDLLVDE